jgi:uncharacterized protein YjbI with pentapeptide repeats
MAKKAKRRTFEESWKHLRRRGRAVLIDHHAGWDREGDPVDITFFRTYWEDADLSNLTLPRRYINRTELQRVSFRNTDLSQSFMCWNDFVDCDFTDADLACCDMRASIFRECSFVRCKLTGADLRGSLFEGCGFTNADLRGAWLDDDFPADLTVEQASLRAVACEWPEPRGG